MTDNLKDKFDKSDFESHFDEEPLSGHRERFKTKLLALDKKSGKGRSFPLWVSVLVAASVCVLIIGLVHSNIQKEKQAYQEYQLADVNEETNKIEAWYTAAIDAKMKEVDMADPEIAAYLTKLEYLETEYQKLVEALNTNFGNEAVISAMIDNYKLRLTLLENIKQYLRIKNSEKSNDNDTYNV